MPADTEESQWVVNFTVSAAARNITANETLATTINATTDNMPIDASKKALSTAAKGKTKRRKRQISQFNFGSLKNTAYEGQDRLFQREPPIGAVNTRFVALDEWSRRQPQSAATQQPMGIIEAGGQNQTPMYLPWRTMIGHGSAAAGGSVTNGAQPATDQKLPWGNNVAADVFYDPAKCDGGVDPYWCAEYVRHFLAGGNAFNSRTTVADQASAACPALLDALWKSDHHCCNILKRMGC